MAQRNYESLFSPYEASLYADADQAITNSGLWGWLYEYTPPKEKGWMFDDHPFLDILQTHMKLIDEHSGASFAVTMRAMEYIAKNGWNKFVEQVKFRRNVS
jgi:hypothetical protein